MNKLKVLIVFLIGFVLVFGYLNAAIAFEGITIELPEVAGEGAGLVRPTSIIDALTRDWKEGENRAVVGITYDGGGSSGSSKVAAFGHAALLMRLSDGTYVMAHLRNSKGDTRVEDWKKMIANPKATAISKRKAKEDMDDYVRTRRSGVSDETLRVRRWATRDYKEFSDSAGRYEIIKYINDLSDDIVGLIQERIDLAFYKLEVAEKLCSEAHNAEACRLTHDPELAKCAFTVRGKTAKNCLEFIEYALTPTFFSIKCDSKIPWFEHLYVQAEGDDGKGTPGWFVRFSDSCAACCYSKSCC